MSTVIVSEASGHVQSVVKKAPVLRSGRKVQPNTNAVTVQENGKNDLRIKQLDKLVTKREEQNRSLFLSR